MNQEWLINKDDLEIYYDKCIGSGQYGSIYLAKWRKTIVAAKLFHKISDDKLYLIKREIQIMTKLHHPNIIQLFGYVTNPFIIIMEYIDGKNLSTYIEEKKLSFYKKINIIKQITSGLIYLHKRNPTYIIHRDLKPSNILVTNKYKVKIIDFGISKLLANNNNDIILSNQNLKNLESFVSVQNTNNVGTIRYMAPEVYNSTTYNYKIDIYSLGIIIYELFEEKRFDLNTSIENEFKINILKNMKPKWSNYFIYFYKTPYKLRNIIERCWSIEPNDRPSSIELLNYLESM